MTTMTTPEATLAILPHHLIQRVLQQGLHQALTTAESARAAAETAYINAGYPARGPLREARLDTTLDHLRLTRLNQEVEAADPHPDIPRLCAAELDYRSSNAAPTSPPTPVLMSEDGGMRLYPAAHIEGRTFVSIASSISLQALEYYDHPDRRADGAFAGCSNAAWIITQREAEAYQTLNAARAARAAKAKTERELRELEIRIARMGDPAKLPTRATASRRQAAYNRVVNEGGEGFVPHLYTREEYEWTLARIRTLRAAAA